MSAHAELWARLARDDIVHGAPPADGDAGAPWYVTAMVGAAAWIAALFLLGFIGAFMYALVRTLDAPLPVGAAICIAAVALLRRRADGLFLRQLAVAFSLAGQALVVFGLTDHHLREPVAWFGVALFEAALVAAAPETVHRALAALACIVAVRIALITGGAPWFVAPLLLAAVLAVYVAAARAPLHEALWSPLWAALGLAVLALLPLTLVDGVFWYGSRATPSAMPARAGGVLTGIAWLALVAVLVRGSGVPLRTRAGALVAIAALGVAASAAWLPMVVVALALLLVAFAAGRRVLAGVAVLALLGTLAHAYYSLQWSLLAKSGALAATGATLLLAAAGARLAREPGARDA